MTKPKQFDAVKAAKAIAKSTNVPLPQVAQIMQKYPLNAQYAEKVHNDLKQEQGKLLVAALKDIGIY